MILVVILQDETFSMLVLELSHFESVPKRGIELHEVCFSLMSAHIKAVTGDTILEQGVEFSISSASEKRKPPNLV